MSQDVLLAYVDFLGFGEYVRQNPEAEKFKEKIERVFLYVKKELIDRLKNPEEGVHDNVRLLISSIAESIDYLMISDSLIVWLDLKEKISVCESCFSDADPSKIPLFVEQNSFYIFLNVVSTLVYTLVFETGLLVRGGIARGGFQMSRFDRVKGIFLFSGALVQAIDLEKRANMPRILVSDEIFNQAHDKKSFPENERVWKSVFIDQDGEYVLDYYEYLSFYPSKVLDSIFRGVPLGEVASNKRKCFHEIINDKLCEYGVGEKQDRKKWSKWHWFKEYHNSRIKKIDRKYLAL